MQTSSQTNTDLSLQAVTLVESPHLHFYLTFYKHSGNSYPQIVLDLCPQGRIFSIGEPQFGIGSKHDFLGSFSKSFNENFPHAQRVTNSGFNLHGSQ